MFSRLIVPELPDAEVQAAVGGVVRGEGPSPDRLLSRYWAHVLFAIENTCTVRQGRNQKSTAYKNIALCRHSPFTVSSLLPSLSSFLYWQWGLLGKDGLLCPINNNASGGCAYALCSYFCNIMSTPEVWQWRELLPMAHKACCGKTWREGRKTWREGSILFFHLSHTVVAHSQHLQSLLGWNSPPSMHAPEHRISEQKPLLCEGFHPVVQILLPGSRASSKCCVMLHCLCVHTCLFF